MSPVLLTALASFQAIGGIGIAFDFPDSTSTTAWVVGVGESLPAHAAGVLPGDVLLAANGTTLVGMSLEEMRDVLRGPEGSTVSLEVGRDGGTQVVTMTRDSYDAEGVRLIGFGCFSGDCENGSGTYVWSSPPARYEGQFQNGVRHGAGILYWADGERLSATWLDGTSVSGTRTYASGIVYSGALRDGFPDGRGEMTWPSGHSLQAEWVDDVVTTGTMTYPEGRVYEGDLDEELRPDGQGTMTFPDETVWRGRWSAGTHVSGTRDPPGPEMMQGVFVDDFLEGEGVRVTRLGDRMTGYFEAGAMLDGHVQYASGHEYDGEFIRVGDLIHRNGIGTFSLPNGDTLVGIWVDEQLPSGTLYFALGGEYEGALSSNNPDGRGTLRAPGFELEGDFEDGAWVGPLPTDALLGLLGQPASAAVSGALGPVLGPGHCPDDMTSCWHSDSGTTLRWNEDGVYSEILMLTQGIDDLEGPYPGSIPYGIPRRGGRSELEAALGTPLDVVSYRAGDRLVYERGPHRAVVHVSDYEGVTAVTISLLGQGPELVAEARDGSVAPASDPTTVDDVYRSAAAPATPFDPFGERSGNPAPQAGSGPRFCADLIEETYTGTGWTLLARQARTVSPTLGIDTWAERPEGWASRVAVVGSSEIGEIFLEASGYVDGAPYGGTAASTYNEALLSYGCTALGNEDRARGRFQNGRMDLFVSTGPIGRTYEIFILVFGRPGGE